MAHGEADSYYNAPLGGQQQMQYPPEAAYQGGPQESKYQQPPPNYGQNYNAGPPPQAPMGGADGKQTFEQAFKLDKPKYNDIWAGILVPPSPATFQPIESISNDDIL